MKEVQINNIQINNEGDLIVNYNDNEEKLIKLSDDEKKISADYIDVEEIKTYLENDLI